MFKIPWLCSRISEITFRVFFLAGQLKYQELAENVGQEQYAFDITSNDFSSDKVIAAADYLIAHLNKESGIIKEHVVEIQKYNCFDQIEEWLR